MAVANSRKTIYKIYNLNIHGIGVFRQMAKEKSMSKKEYCRIIHKHVDHYVNNRPTERAPKVEYTDDEETARKFFEEDFEVLEIDWSIHDKIIYESTHIRIQRSERVEVNE